MPCRIYDYTAYTDGGSNNLSPYGEGGSAYVLLQDGEVIKSASKGFLGTTNNRMEMLAIVSAVASIPKGSSILIYTDSQYCIQMFTAKKVGANAKNQDLIYRFRQFSSGKNVDFEWVKGHDGNEYNELCDSMCTEEIEKIRKDNGIPLFSTSNSPKVKRSK